MVPVSCFFWHTNVFQLSNSRSMLRNLFPLAALAFICATITAKADDSQIWVEGENATGQAHVVANSGLNAANPYIMSGGAWLSNFSEANMADTGTASYAVKVHNTGDYNFWVRATGSGLSYRLDGGAWTDIDLAKGVDPVNSAADGNNGWPPQLNWYNAGALHLTADSHTIEFLLGGQVTGKGRFAALDCFVLTTGTFTPNSKYKPGEPAPVPTLDIPADKAWDFTPAADTFSPTAVLDLRYLNEKNAGDHGFIKLSADGNSFVRGDGQPIRFWATGETSDLKFEDMKRHAQFLAKRGVNIIRMHVQIPSQVEGSGPGDVDKDTLDYIYRTEAAMKSAGIYSIISPYWADHVNIQKSWGTMGEPGKAASGLIYFEPNLQKMYQSWMKTLYGGVNPYTNMRLADDPAVAIIQFQNENGLLWWNTSTFSGPVLTYFRGLYAKFLTDKYGSLDKARAAWGDYNPPAGELFIPNDWAHGLPGMPHIWDLTRDAMVKKGPWPGFIRCSGDFTEFLCRTMHDFDTSTANYMRHDLGCKQLISTDNWRGPDGLTQDAEYWADTAGDVVAKNTYTGGYHKGVNDGWQVLLNSYYSNDSIIKNPVALPMNFKHPVGHPVMVPETSWVHPDMYQSEGPLMMAAQSDLTGFNIGSWFVTEAAEWNNSAITKWSDSTPMLLGQFPANALIYREGLVAAGQPAVVENRPLSDVFDRKAPLIYDETGYDDPNHHAGVTLNGGNANAAVDQLAYLVGPVMVNFGGDPAKNQVLDMSKYIDHTTGIVHSDTGQITTDMIKGIYRVDAPKAQAVSGFLKAAGPQKLTDVTFDCTNDYATVEVVPMDQSPVKTSRQLLVQVGTVSRPTGWMSEPATLFLNNKPFECRRLGTPGTMPWQVEKASVTLSIDNPGLTTATLLDLDGLPTATPIELTRAKGAVKVTLPPNAMYLVLSAGPAKSAPAVAPLELQAGGVPATFGISTKF